MKCFSDAGVGGSWVGRFKGFQKMYFGVDMSANVLCKKPEVRPLCLPVAHSETSFV